MLLLMIEHCTNKYNKNLKIQSISIQYNLSSLTNYDAYSCVNLRSFDNKLSHLTLIII